MPEQHDDRLRQAFAHHLRHQRQVIILDQHHRTRARGFGHHGLGEAAVDPHVMLPIGAAESRLDVGAVAQRPQAFVGQAVVVAGDFVLVQPQAAQTVGCVQVWLAHMVALVAGGAVGVAATVGDPAAALLGQHGFERRDQAAGGTLGRDALWRMGMDAGSPVRDDDQVVATAQLLDQARQVGAVAHVVRREEASRRLMVAAVTAIAGQLLWKMGR